MLLIMTAVFQTAVTLGMRLYAKGLESTPHCLGDTNPFNCVELDQRESTPRVFGFDMEAAFQSWLESSFEKQFI